MRVEIFLRFEYPLSKRLDWLLVAPASFVWSSFEPVLRIVSLNNFICKNYADINCGWISANSTCLKMYYDVFEELLLIQY